MSIRSGRRLPRNLLNSFVFLRTFGWKYDLDKPSYFDQHSILVRFGILFVFVKFDPNISSTKSHFESDKEEVWGSFCSYFQSFKILTSRRFVSFIKNCGCFLRGETMKNMIQVVNMTWGSQITVGYHSQSQITVASTGWFSDGFWLTTSKLYILKVSNS